ncbi:thiol-disulfide oxidoreductase DCC family protein [Bacillus sp. HMF5848]|uniref:thiol-disulfide oxidoreductase DCC family protein n=1 Tax=Bacillus sp. HMF5848 TaxID=2495421 RepID=UPI000F798CB4|nr:thiol-disulfide oxidoreductase DCC family protein [Bacillus sp. HMF5848]
MHPIILFDGVCNLCEGIVQFIIRHDKKAVFRFASLQSNIGRSLLKKHNLPVDDLDSFVLIVNNQAYIKSTAALKLALWLGGGWRLAYVGIMLPSVIRNRMYDFVARNRYKWFGRKQACMMPTPEIKLRFLDEE